MTENILLLRHYIFINPTNIFEDINNETVLDDIKKVHSKYYVHGEIVKYYGYNDVVCLLNGYDKQLCRLFTEINYNYPALLADIGRLIILYKYGGVYHDLKCISNKKMIDYLNSVPPDIQLIGDEHPIEKYRVRNTNIVALQKNCRFISLVLQKLKHKLLSKRDAFGPHMVFEIGSFTFIREFLENTSEPIFKYPFHNDCMITFHPDIYVKNIKKWQHTHEYIFRKLGA
jgi:hypothetical protein